MKQAASVDSVSRLDRDMAEKNLSGYWRLGMEGLPPHPMTAVEPCLWKWTDVYDSLVRAGEVISLENSERRVVRLVNPGLNHTASVRDAYAANFISIRQARRKCAGAPPHAGGAALCPSRQRRLHDGQRPAMRHGARRSDSHAEAHLA